MAPNIITVNESSLTCTFRSKTRTHCSFLKSPNEAIMITDLINCQSLLGLSHSVWGNGNCKKHALLSAEIWYHQLIHCVVQWFFIWTPLPHDCSNRFMSENNYQINHSRHSKLFARDSPHQGKWLTVFTDRKSEISSSN